MIFADLSIEDPEPDEGLAALLDMLPADKRDLAEPMMRGYLNNVKAQLSPEDYLTYCADLKRAYEAHSSGDHTTAASITAKYGLPYEMLVGAVS